jgi:hypothetical protein
MSDIASLLTAVAALIVAVGALYLIVRLSKAVDAMVEYMKKDDD